MRLRISRFRSRESARVSRGLVAQVSISVNAVNPVRVSANRITNNNALPIWNVMSLREAIILSLLLQEPEAWELLDKMEKLVQEKGIRYAALEAPNPQTCFGDPSRHFGLLSTFPRLGLRRNVSSFSGCGKPPLTMAAQR